MIALNDQINAGAGEIRSLIVLRLAAHFLLIDLPDVLATTP